MINQNFWCGSFQASSNLLHNLSVIELKSTDNSLMAAFISSNVGLFGEDGGGGNPGGVCGDGGVPGCVVVVVLGGERE